MISWFFPRRHHRKDHKRRPSPGWLDCATHAAPRRTAEAATSLLITILVGFAMHGVRHVSRRPVAGSVFRTSFQQDRCGSFSAGDPPAGSVLCRTYDIHLDQRARVLFGFKKRNGDTESRLVALALHDARVSLRRATGPRSRYILRLFSSVARRSTALPGLLNFFSIAANPVSLPLETLLSNRTSVKVSFPKPTSRINDDFGSSKMFFASLCSATVGSTEL